MIEKLEIPQDSDPVEPTALDYLMDKVLENREKQNEIVDVVNTLMQKEQTPNG